MSRPDEQIAAFLSATYDNDESQASSAPSSRPFVTLTYCQSLDARIAGVGGVQLRLSGKESMAMTHS